MHSGRTKLCFCLPDVSNNISFIGFICIFCYLPVQALNLLWISALLLLLVHFYSVSCHYIMHTAEGAVFIVSLQTPSLQISLLLLSKNTKKTSIHFSQKRFGKSDEWNKVFFPLRRKSNASVYKTLCVWLLWIEMYVFLYFALCLGSKFFNQRLVSFIKNRVRVLLY